MRSLLICAALALVPTFAWADEPAATADTVTLPYGVVAIHRVTTGTSFDALKGKKLSKLTVRLRSGSHLEGLVETAELREALQISASDGNAVDYSTDPKQQAVTVEAVASKAGVTPTFDGNAAAAALSMVSLRLAPLATDRSVVVTYRTDGGEELPLDHPVSATVQSAVETSLTLEAEQLTWPAEGSEDQGQGYDVVSRTLRLGEHIARPEVGAMETTGITVTRLRVGPGRLGASGGNLLQPDDCLDKSGGTLIANDKVRDDKTFATPGNRRTCADAATQVEVNLGPGGKSLQEALDELHKLALITRRGFAERSLVVSAEWQVGGDGGPRGWLPLLGLRVRPALPKLPEACVELGLYRHTRGFRPLQGPVTHRVLRLDEVIESAKVAASWASKSGKPLGSEACKGFVDRYGNEDLELQLAVTRDPLLDVPEACVEKASGEGCEPSNGAVLGDGISILTRKHRAAHWSRRSSSVPFRSAWLTTHDKAEDLALGETNDDTSATAEEPDGAYHLQAHALLVSADGTNRSVVRSNVDVSAMVDLSPTLSFEVVNHPVATALTFVTCRDVNGLDGAEAEDEICDGQPDRVVTTAEVATVPFGLKGRWTPFYQMSWLGLAAEVNFASVGGSTVVDDSFKDDRSTVGVLSHGSVLGGLDLNVELANKDNSGSSHLGFMLHGGVATIVGAEGVVFRPTVGLSVAVRAIQFGGRKSDSATNTSATDESASDSPGGES